MIVKKKSQKPKKPKQIIIYKEDLESDEEEKIEVIQKVKRGKGRPKKKKIIEYVDEAGNKIENQKKASQTIINHDNIPENPSQKDIKIMELQSRLAELEQISGKKIRATNKNQPDKRQTKARTKKQIEQTRRLVELNKLRKMERDKKKQEENRETQKDNIKQVITELKNLKPVKQQEQEIKKPITPIYEM